MVQIPQYAQQEGLAAPSRDIPNVVQPDDGGIGQALSSLGGAITNIAEAVQARKQRQAAFDAKVGMDTYTEKMQQAQVELERDAPPDGRGIHDALLSKRSQYAAEYLATITDPVMRENARKVLDSSDAEYWSNQGANAEWKIGNKYSIDQTQTMWGKRQQGIAANPAAVKAYVADMEDTIDKAPNLTPAQRAEMKQKVREQGPKLAAEALTTMDPEVAHFMRTRSDNDPSNPNLPTETQRIDFLTRRAASAMPGVDGAKLKAAITKHGGDVEAAFGDIADEMGVKDKDKPAFIENGMNGMGAARLISGKGGNVKAAPGGGGSSVGLVSRFEGFRTAAYWDVNHWRVGYGSDTVTRADGTIERVTKDTRVTRVDADRDLNRRINETQSKISSQVGDGWNSLSEGAKAALTSVAYNYGSLPGSVAAAARTGDGQQVAQAILGLTGHNGGVNSSRRKQEAAIAAGGALPKGNVQVADASGTGGLSMNDAGPQTADGVPGSAPPGNGFVAPVFQDLPAEEQLRLQGQGSTAYAKAAQTQLAQSTADEILSASGATEDMAGDRKAAYTALDSIGDAELKKDVAPLIESHFNRWEQVQKDREEQQYQQVSSQVQALVDQGQTQQAFALLKQSGLQGEKYSGLMTRISKGAVPFDDPKATLEIGALKMRPEEFASTDIAVKYGNTLTADTIAKLQADQMSVKKTLAGQGDDASKLAIETVTKANSIIEQNLKAIGIVTTDDKVSPEDIQHANLVRSMTQKEIEALQAKNGGRPLMISEISDAVSSVMKTYPRFTPVEGSWMPWRSADTDVSMPEVLQAYDGAKLDIQQAADALRKAGKPVNPQTLQQTLDDYLAVNNGGQ